MINACGKLSWNGCRPALRHLHGEPAVSPKSSGCFVMPPEEE
jgi:hypothetical protein